MPFSLNFKLYTTDYYFQDEDGLHLRKEGGALFVEAGDKAQAFIAAYIQLTKKGLLVCTVTPEIHIVQPGGWLTPEEMQKVYSAGVPQNSSDDQTAMTHIEDIREFDLSDIVTPSSDVKVPTQEQLFVDSSRIDQLRAINSPKFDLKKLIRLCEEVNVCYAGTCYLAVAMLIRAILDHVPPIFGCDSFEKVANNYPGTRSFKDQMKHLNSSLRKIADAQLHTQIRSSETLPNQTQVNFAADIDVLLGEIIRVLV